MYCTSLGSSSIKKNENDYLNISLNIFVEYLDVEIYKRFPK